MLTDNIVLMETQGKFVLADNCTCNLFILNQPPVYSHLWFLLALVYCYLTILIFTNTKKQVERFAYLSPFLMICLALFQEFSTYGILKNAFQIPGSEEYLICSSMFVFRALPFFLHGILVRKYEKKISEIKINKIALRLIIFAALTTSIMEGFIFPVSQVYVGTYIALLAISVYYVKYPSIKSRCLEYIGKRLSTNIYIFHIAVGKLYDIVAGRYNLWRDPVFQWTKPLVVLTVVLLFVVLFDRIAGFMKRNRIYSE